MDPLFVVPSCFYMHMHVQPFPFFFVATPTTNIQMEQLFPGQMILWYLIACALMLTRWSNYVAIEGDWGLASIPLPSQCWSEPIYDIANGVIVFSL